MATHHLYHAGIPTFMGAPQCSLEDLQPGALAVVGVPYDYACGSRPGARWGPRAIRQSSLFFDYFFRSESDQDYVDVSTGKAFHFQQNVNLVDLGDVELYPMDVQRTMETISGFIQQVVEKGAIPIILGGDHFITYPSFCGYSKGVSAGREHGRANIGYIHLDSHFDMFDHHPAWGEFYHGSTVRRIAESEAVDTRNMLVIGVHGLVGKETYEFLHRNLIRIVPLQELRAKGFGPPVRKKVEELVQRGVDRIYLSVDIDVVNCAFAPGTGGISLEGITPAQLNEIMGVLEDYPIGALDVAEVAPNYDPAERTQRLAAETVFHFIQRKGNPEG